MKIALPHYLLIAVLGLTACDKRAPLRAELTMAETEMREKQAQVLKIQEELRVMPSLGKHNFAGPSQIQALRAEVDQMEAAIKQLKEDKIAAEAVNEKIRTEVETYLSQNSKK